MHLKFFKTVQVVVKLTLFWKHILYNSQNFQVNWKTYMYQYYQLDNSKQMEAMILIESL